MDGTFDLRLISTFGRALFDIENNLDCIFLQNFVEFLNARAVLVEFEYKVDELTFILCRSQLFDLIEVSLQFTKL